MSKANVARFIKSKWLSIVLAAMLSSGLGFAMYHLADEFSAILGLVAGMASVAHSLIAIVAVGAVAWLWLTPPCCESESL